MHLPYPRMPPKTERASRIQRRGFSARHMRNLSIRWKRAVEVVCASCPASHCEPLLTTDPGLSSDVHVYYTQSQLPYARQLYDRIRREFPELRIYRFWDKPVGPHPFAMFEVNVFTPAQFGAFVPWLVIWRGELSVLVHPNTTVAAGALVSEAELRNHTQRATWMGEKVPLDVSVFLQWRQKELEEREKGNP